LTVEIVRLICLTFAGATEDIAWGNERVFSLGDKMFAAIDIDPRHGLAFKCSPESFSELIERERIVPEYGFVIGFSYTPMQVGL